jgi:predicted nucleotidyltransferase
MPASRQLAIPIPHEEIAAFCRKWGIRKLSFFGSVVRDDFDPERSDVDVLVEAKAGSLRTFGDLFDAERDLSEIFDGRKVDLLENVKESVWPYVKDDLVVEYVEES